MAKRKIDHREFWEKKILAWEENRYIGSETRYGLLERIAHAGSNSLRFRIQLAAKYLKPYVHGKRVVEIGCGTGRLAKDLIDAGAIEYTGYDVAETAIVEANKIALENGILEKANFIRSSVEELPSFEADVVLSLGLFDWLENHEIDHVFKTSGNADFFHSISEKRNSPAQWIHRYYVFLAYGYKTRGYAPKYHSVSHILGIARNYTDARIHEFRDTRLSFGAILTTLPPIASVLETL